MLHQKIFVPYIILFTARLSLFHTESMFLPLKYIVYRCYSCFRQRGAQFFHRHTCIQWLHSFSLYIMHLYTLVTLFRCFIRKYLSHSLYCSQPVSVCFTLNLCFLLQNTLSTDVTVASGKEGLNFSIVTLVYRDYIAFPYIMHCIHLSRFFGASSQNICPIHYIVHSLSQSVSHWISVFSFKIHCLQMLQLFQTKRGSIFSSSHLYTVVA